MTDDELDNIEGRLHFDEPIDASEVRALVAEVRRLRAERRRHVAALAECYRLTGADPDGHSDRALAPYAVREVGRLRDELDEVDEANVALLAELARYRDGIVAHRFTYRQHGPLIGADLRLWSLLDPEA